MFAIPRKSKTTFILLESYGDNVRVMDSSDPRRGRLASGAEWEDADVFELRS